MKRFTIVLLTICFLHFGTYFGLAYEPPLGLPVNGLKATISLKSEVFAPDSIQVFVSLRNVSEQVIQFDPWIGNWFIQVYDEKVNVINPLNRARDVLRPISEPMNLSPGEKWEIEIIGLKMLSGEEGSTPYWEYELLKPGIYWLGAEYHVYSNPRFPSLWSGSVNTELIQIKIEYLQDDQFRGIYDMKGL